MPFDPDDPISLSDFDQGFQDLGLPDSDGSALFSQATDDAPPPSDWNFPGADLIKFGAKAGLDWASSPGGDLQPADWQVNGSMGYSGGNLGVGPRVIPRSQANGVRGGDVLALASANAGFRITRKTLFYMIKKFGIPAVMQLTRLTAELLLAMWMKRPKRGSRGPHLRTVVKRVRQGRRYEAMLRKYGVQAGRGGGGHRPKYAFQKRRRK